MASISGWMGDGLQGTPSACNDPYDNPVINFGQSFGHPHVDDIINMLSNCTCSIYGAKTSFDLTSLSTCHEVVFIYYRMVVDVDGRTYRVENRVEKNGVETSYAESEFVWDDAYAYFHSYYLFGWAPCFWLAGGSMHNPSTGYNAEIYDNGSDYEVFVEIWDTVTETKVAEYSQTFTITNLSHTVMSGTIQNYAGENVKGDIRIRAEYTLPTGACSDGSGGYTGEVYYQRAEDDNYNYNINVDGMEGLVRITPYKAGYKLKEIEFSGITAKDLNIDNDFTGTDYLPCAIQGTVVDSDTNPVENANVWITSAHNNTYGCKTNSSGLYALPVFEWSFYDTARATKNNFNIVEKGINENIPVHPTITYWKNIILTRKSDPTGNYAHANSLCVDDQSIIILDDPVTSSTLIKPATVGATIIKVKTRKWGTGAAQCTTSTGTSNGGVGYGSGGFNYDGDTGDAESWE